MILENSIMYRNNFFLGSTLCQDIDWCRIVNCIILCPLHPFILMLNCIHGPNQDGTAWLDVNCCYDNANECFRPRDLSTNTDSHSESSPLISPVVTYSWNNFFNFLSILMAWFLLWMWLAFMTSGSSDRSCKI